jgi:hypothetical protein
MRDEGDRGRRLLLRLAPNRLKITKQARRRPLGNQQIRHGDPVSVADLAGHDLGRLDRPHEWARDHQREFDTPSGQRASQPAGILSSAGGQRSRFVSRRVVAGLRVPDERHTHDAAGRVT